MPNLNAGIRIEGAKNARGQVKQFSPKALQAIQAKAEKRADQTLEVFRAAMAQEYTSKWSEFYGRGKGLSKQVEISGNGVDVSFMISSRRELEFITALLGGYFQQFPVGPFRIVPRTAKLLFIRYPGRGRQFTRGAGGRFTGSKAGPGIRVRSVLWGNKTGGFSRDVLSEVGAQEGAAFMDDMVNAVKGVVASTKS